MSEQTELWDSEDPMINNKLQVFEGDLPKWTGPEEIQNPAVENSPVETSTDKVADTFPDSNPQYEAIAQMAAKLQDPLNKKPRRLKKNNPPYVVPQKGVPQQSIPDEATSKSNESSKSNVPSAIDELKELLEPMTGNEMEQDDKASFPLSQNPATTSSDATTSSEANTSEQEVNKDGTKRPFATHSETVDDPPPKKNKEMNQYKLYEHKDDEDDKIYIYDRIRRLMRHSQRLRGYVELHTRTPTLQAYTSEMKLVNNYIDFLPGGKGDFEKELWISMMLDHKPSPEVFHPQPNPPVISTE